MGKQSVRQSSSSGDGKVTLIHPPSGKMVRVSVTAARLAQSLEMKPSDFTPAEHARLGARLAQATKRSEARSDIERELLSFFRSLTDDQRRCFLLSWERQASGEGGAA